MPPLVAGLGAAAGLGSGIAGAVAGNNASKRAARTAADAANRFYAFEDPDYARMRLQLEEMVQQGQLAPEEAVAIMQDPSLMGGVTQDPRLQKAELDALESMGRVGMAEGLDAESQAAIAQALGQSQAAARGARQANLRSAAERGVSGSGLEFALNQMADQDAATQANMLALQNAAQGEQRKMAALEGYADLAENMSSRDIALQTAKAQAEDARNKFNTTLANDANMYNVQSRNLAQESNLKEKQRVADSNVAMRNQQQQYNKSLEQQKFDNALARAQGAAGIAGTQANAQIEAGKNLSNTLGGIGQSLVGAGASIYSNMKDKKKDEV